MQVYLGYVLLYNLGYSFFVLKFANLRYHGNRGQSEQFLTVTCKQADPQNPLLGASVCVIIHNPIYRQKIRDFSLPWQQGRSRQICLTPLNVPTLNTYRA